MKLYGDELDIELAKRKVAKDIRKEERKTLRARAKELEMDPSEYCDWERGSDVCPHEEYEKSLVGIHRPFFLMKTCIKCGKPNIIAKLETEEDWDKHRDELDEVFKKRNTTIV